MSRRRDPCRTGLWTRSRKYDGRGPASWFGSHTHTAHTLADSWHVLGGSHRRTRTRIHNLSSPSFLVVFTHTLSSPSFLVFTHTLVFINSPPHSFNTSSDALLLIHLQDSCLFQNLVCSEEMPKRLCGLIPPPPVSVPPWRVLSLAHVCLFVCLTHR